MADDDSPFQPPFEPSGHRPLGGQEQVGVQGVPIESAETPIASLVSRDVVTVSPVTPVSEAVALFRAQGISHLPVVDAHGRLVGLVSKTDVVQELGGPAPPKPLLREDAVMSDVMQRRLLTVTEDTPIARAAALMASYRVHALPVVVNEDRLVGLLSSLDILGWVGGAD